MRTLAAWRERFLAQTDAVRALGFDERFIRTWEYYLALSQAGFATGKVHLIVESSTFSRLMSWPSI